MYKIVMEVMSLVEGLERRELTRNVAKIRLENIINKVAETGLKFEEIETFSELVELAEGTIEKVSLELENKSAKDEFESAKAHYVLFRNSSTENNDILQNSYKNYVRKANKYYATSKKLAIHNEYMETLINL